MQPLSVDSPSPHTALVDTVTPGALSSSTNVPTATDSVVTITCSSDAPKASTISTSGGIQVMSSSLPSDALTSSASTSSSQTTSVSINGAEVSGSISDVHKTEALVCDSTFVASTTVATMAEHLKSKSSVSNSEASKSSSPIASNELDASAVFGDNSDNSPVKVEDFQMKSNDSTSEDLASDTSTSSASPSVATAFGTLTSDAKGSIFLFGKMQSTSSTSNTNSTLPFSGFKPIMTTNLFSASQGRNPTNPQRKTSGGVNLKSGALAPSIMTFGALASGVTKAGPLTTSGLASSTVTNGTSIFSPTTSDAIFGVRSNTSALSTSTPGVLRSAKDIQSRENSTSNLQLSGLKNITANNSLTITRIRKPIHAQRNTGGGMQSNSSALPSGASIPSASSEPSTSGFSTTGTLPSSARGDKTKSGSGFIQIPRETTVGVVSSVQLDAILAVGDSVQEMRSELAEYMAEQREFRDELQASVARLDARIDGIERRLDTLERKLPPKESLEQLQETVEQLRLE